jgi:hypothetical protein
MEKKDYEQVCSDLFEDVKKEESKQKKKEEEDSWTKQLLTTLSEPDNPAARPIFGSAARLCASEIKQIKKGTYRNGK